MSETPQDLDSAVPPPRIVAVEDRPFWDAIDQGTLALARCACGRCYARSQACLACGAPADAMRWVPASGAATLVSYVVFDKAYHPYFTRRLPYAVAVVALAEGPELVTNLVGVDWDRGGESRLRLGMPVRLRVTTRGGRRLHEAEVVEG